MLPNLVCSQLGQIDSILIRGVEKTKHEVILRQLTVHSGDSVDLSKLEELKNINHNNIYNLGLFTVVKVETRIISGKVSFDIVVKERWYIWPTPYFALEERTFNEWWQDKDLDRAVYGMGIGWENFSGWNDRLYAYGQIGYSRRLAFSFTRPFLFPKAKVDGTAGFRFVNNKEIGYGTENGVLKLIRLKEDRMRKSFETYVQVAKRFSPRKLFYFNLNFHYFKSNDSIRFLNSNYMTNDKYIDYYPSFTFSYVNDQRDLATFPLKGYKYSFLLRHSGIPGFLSTTVFTKMSLVFSHHIPLGNRFYFAYGTQNFFLIGNKVPWYDKYFIGFVDFLRGYEPYVIDGSIINITRTELKFALINRHMVKIEKIPFKKFRDFPLGLYLSVFGESGYVIDNTFSNFDPTFKNRLLTGYGAGINFITMYDFLLRVEYSRNHMGGGGIYLHSTVSIR